MTAIPDASKLFICPDIKVFEHFLSHEVRLLDEKRWEEWQALFTEDGDYWVPLTADQPDPFSYASLFYDDRQLMELRIRRFSHPHIFSQQPQSRTMHMISNAMIDSFNELTGECIVSSRFIMLEYRRDNQVLYGGTCTYNLVSNNGDYKIKRKRVDLVNSEAAHTNLQIYF